MSPIVINVPTRALLADETKGSFVRLLANLNIKRNLTAMFVNKYLLNQADTKVGPDQLGPPVRVESTQIASDPEKKNIKLNVTETFTHLKVTIPVKTGPN